MAIPYEVTNDIGYYMRLIPGLSDDFIYIGAATSVLDNGYGKKGIAQGTAGHEAASNYVQPIKSIHYRTVEGQLAQDACKWVNLMTFKVDENSSVGEMCDLVALCYVAETMVSHRITAGDREKTDADGFVSSHPGFKRIPQRFPTKLF